MRTSGKGLATLVWVLLTAATSVGAAQSTNADDLYAEAVVREASLRRDLGVAEPTATAPVFRRIRTLVGAFQDLAKLFPSSTFADDALWHGATLSADTFEASSEPIDRETALRLFTRLTATFPSSPLARQVAPRIAGLSTATRRSAPSDTASSTAFATASSTASSTASVLAGSPPSGGVLASRPAPATRDVTAPVRPAPDGAAPPSAPPSASPTASLTGQTTPVLLTAIRRQERADALRVVLELEREITFSAERLDGPPRLFLDLQHTRAVDALSHTVPTAGGAVRQIRIGQQAGRTRIVFDLHEGAGPHSVYVLYNPYRVVVDFERPLATAAPAPADALSRADALPRADPAARAGAVSRADAVAKADAVPRTGVVPRQAASVSPSTPGRVARPAWLASRRLAVSSHVRPPAVEPARLTTVTATPDASAPARPVAAPVASVPPAANASGRFSLARQLGLGISRVVIDPGHGGHDPGAKVRGLTEAELALDIALRLEHLLQTTSGIDVVLTRRTDAFVSLEERTAVANRADADAFLSLHVNASRDGRANGVESYFLDVAPTATAEAVAARENATSSRNMRHLPELLRVLTLGSKLAESRDLATALQTSLHGRVRQSNRGVRNLGVKQAPFMVLLGATMPAALIELSFITNSDDAARLRTQSYRQLLADGLHAGLLRYQQSVKRAAAIAQR